MKRPLAVAASAILLVSTILFSCSDKEHPEPAASTGSLIATLDGAAWKSTVASAVIINGTINIAAKDAAGNTIEISVLKDDVKGTYNVKGVDTGVPDATVSLTPKTGYTFTSAYYAAGTSVGTITISEIDETNKTISGTFSSKIKREVPKEEESELKSGSFNKVPYTTKPATSTTDSFSAKIDGTVFTPTIIGGVKALGSINLNFSNSNASKIIAIIVPDNATTGSHTFGKFGETYYATYSTGGTNINESVSGSVNVTLHNTTTKRIEGTFSFSAEPFPSGGTAVSISAGSFAVTYN